MEAHGLIHSGGRAAATTSRGAAFRRGLDVVLALVLLVLLGPVLLLLALIVRVDSPGPALFRQRRVGKAGREFTVHKFRSMRADADVRRHRDYVKELITRRGGDEVSNGDGEKSLYKLVVDDRVTRVGRVMRRLSLDELPQLWNVLRGDMALVGPRPVIPYEVEEYPPEWHERFAVKPGLTGLWQVSGRSSRTYEEMVRLDIDYARSHSLWLDVRILARTCLSVVGMKGAA